MMRAPLNVMRPAAPVAAAVLASAALALVPGIGVPVEAAEEQKVFLPNEIQWNPGLPHQPPGTQIAVLYGKPSEEGLFALRVKFPEGTRIAPHTHPRPEVITVISGTFKLGMGETAQEDSTRALAAGSLFAMPPETAHYASVEGETVIQLNSVGPFGTTFVNPEDDPRLQTQ